MLINSPWIRIRDTVIYYVEEVQHNAIYTIDW